MQACLRVLSLTIVLGLMGCGGSSGPQQAAISGTVKLDGAPVEQGRITFVPAAGTPGSSSAGDIQNGKYTIPAEKGPQFGKFKVQIQWSKKTGKQIEMGSPAPPGTKIDEVIEAIPAKYNTESTLEKEVKAASTVIDFDLMK